MLFTRAGRSIDINMAINNAWSIARVLSFLFERESNYNSNHLRKGEAPDILNMCDCMRMCAGCINVYSVPLQCDAHGLVVNLSYINIERTWRHVNNKKAQTTQKKNIIKTTRRGNTINLSLLINSTRDIPILYRTQHTIIHSFTDRNDVTRVLLFCSVNLSSQTSFLSLLYLLIVIIMIVIIYTVAWLLGCRYVVSDACRRAVLRQAW